jgi:Carboxypeptidase regulatory-like domain
MVVMMRWTLFLLATAAFAQSSISGVVRDQYGSPIERVPIQVKNKATSATASATTALDGSYKIPSVAPGDYEVSVNLPSMTPYTAALTVGAGTATHDAKVAYNTQLGTLGEDFRSAIEEQTRHKPPTGPAPKTFDGHPDFSGVWFRPTTVDPGKPEFVRPAKPSSESNQARCLPSNAMRFGPLFQMVQSKDYLVMINDDDSPGFYQIYLDGRPHPKDPNPQWNGHNTGKWEGDTLVVDRVGFDERMFVDQGGHPNSGKLHIVTRYRRPDAGHLEITATIEDDGALKAPYTMKMAADLAQTEMIYEFICAENERDVQHFSGN